MWSRRGHEIPKTTVPTAGFGSSNKTEECGLFQQSVLLAAIFTGEIECRISVAKAGFHKKK
jgi:hypothetical protein